MKKFDSVSSEGQDTGVEGRRNTGESARRSPRGVNLKMNWTRSVSDIAKTTSELMLSPRAIKRADTEPERPVSGATTPEDDRGLDEIETIHTENSETKVKEKELISDAEDANGHLREGFEKEEKEEKVVRQEALLSSSDSEASSKEDPSQPPKCTADHNDGKTVSDYTVPTDVYTLFNTMFSNSKFINAFQQRRETTGLVLGDWVGSGSQTVRINTYIVKNAQKVGPKHARVTERQVLLPISKPGFLYAIDMESNNSEVALADTFYYSFHICLSRISENESRIIVVAKLTYRKYVLGPIKSIIDKTSWTGIHSFYEDMEQSLKNEFSSSRTEESLSAPELPPATVQLNTSKVRSRRPLRKKRPAPCIPPLASVPTKSSWTHGIFQTVPGNPLNYEVCLHLLICLMTLLLLGFNAYLFIKVQNLEIEIEESGLAKLGVKPCQSEVENGNMADLKERFYKRETLRHLETANLIEPIEMTIEKLRQVEQEIRSLTNLVDMRQDIKTESNNEPLIKT